MLHHPDGTLTAGGFVLLWACGFGLFTLTLAVSAWLLIRGAHDLDLHDLLAERPRGPLADHGEGTHLRHVLALRTEVQRPLVREKGADVPSRCTTPVEDSPDAA